MASPTDTPVALVEKAHDIASSFFSGYKTAVRSASTVVPSPRNLTSQPTLHRDEGDPNVEPLLTAVEVAEILGVHPNYVWAEAKRGRIPSITIGRNRRFRRKDLERWLDENTRRAA